jgi:hypothetical protein
MEQSAVYRKTDKGIAELASSRGQLDRRLRPLLILVDGRRPLDRIKTLVEGLGITSNDLDHLAALGLIELAGKSPATIEVAAEPPTETKAGAPRTNLERFSDGRRFLNETATSVLGVRALFFVLKVEKTSSVADLRALLGDFEAAIAKKRGRPFSVQCRMVAEDILR